MLIKRGIKGRSTVKKNVKKMEKKEVVK